VNEGRSGKMNGYVTQTELKISVADRFPKRTHERIQWAPTRRIKVRELAMMLLSFLF
jgi:hypothetical protein